MLHAYMIRVYECLLLCDERPACACVLGFVFDKGHRHNKQHHKLAAILFYFGTTQRRGVLAQMKSSITSPGAGVDAGWYGQWHNRTKKQVGHKKSGSLNVPELNFWQFGFAHAIYELHEALVAVISRCSMFNGRIRRALGALPGDI